MKRWWNCNVKEKRKILGQEKKRGQNSEAAAQAKEEFQKSIWIFKKQMWSDYLQNLRKAEGWKAIKYINPGACMMEVAVTDREWKHTYLTIEKEEMLR